MSCGQCLCLPCSSEPGYSLPTEAPSPRQGREGKQPCQASSDSAMTLIFQACWWQLCEGWNLSNAGHTAIVLSGCTGVRLWRLLYVQGAQLSPKHSLEKPSGKGRRCCRKHGGFVEWKVSQLTSSDMSLTQGQDSLCPHGCSQLIVVRLPGLHRNECFGSAQACFAALLTELLTFPGNPCNKLTHRYLAGGQK